MRHRGRFPDFVERRRNRDFLTLEDADIIYRGTPSLDDQDGRLGWAAAAVDVDLDGSLELMLASGLHGYVFEIDERRGDDVNGVLLSASVAGRVALGARAGAKVRRLQRGSPRQFRLPRLYGEGQGYNLHAAVVIRLGHRDGLERLCR